MRVMSKASVRTIVALLMLGGWASAGAEEAAGPVTFYKDVLPILQANCQDCHRPGGANLGGMVAPMAFMTYEEVRPWAKSIAQNVSGRTMPPWHADPAHHGTFENERTLAEPEIQTLVRWAATGAVKGDANDAPAPRLWPETGGWTIGEPDLIIRMPEPYFVADDVEDIYVNLRTTVTADQLPEPRWIKATEFRPGSSVVHHIIATPLGGIAPGNDPTIYREGFGRRIQPGMVVTFQMHYHKEPGPGTGVWDQSEIGLRFYPEDAEIRHTLEVEPLGNFRFRIPPGDPNYSARSEFTFQRDSMIVSLMPHMHVRGKAALYVAKYPDGTEETILRVPQYDFNWQTTYRFKEPKVVPAGTKIELTCWWDNSAENPSNPDPTATVVWGQPTTAEMHFGWMAYTNVEPNVASSGGGR